MDWVFESCDCLICGLLVVVGGRVAGVFSLDAGLEAFAIQQ